MVAKTHQPQQERGPERSVRDQREGCDLIKRNAVGKEDRTPEDGQQEEFGPNAGREVFLCAHGIGLAADEGALTLKPAQTKKPRRNGRALMMI